MIDTHAHIDDHQFNADRGEMISRAFSNGVEKIITIGAGLGSSERAVRVASEYENIFAVVGCHPEYFMRHMKWDEMHKQKLEELAGADKVVAIGEIGLEYHSHDGEEITQIQKEFQKEGFVYQLELAKKLKLPGVIHCRGERAEAGEKYREKGEAYEDVLDILNRSGVVSAGRIVFHSFGGNLAVAKKILKFENISFSFNGNLTYAKPNAEILAVVKMIPLERIMLETDCPYLAPVPFRGKRNEPSYVAYVRDKIADIKSVSAEEVDRVTTKNAIEFFGL